MSCQCPVLQVDGHLERPEALPNHTSGDGLGGWVGRVLVVGWCVRWFGVVCGGVLGVRLGGGGEG